MAVFGKLIIALGALLLLHAGYYSVQCMSMPSSIADVLQESLSYVLNDAQMKNTCA